MEMQIYKSSKSIQSFQIVPPPKHPFVLQKQ